MLAAEREPWLVIDPKPLSGDPAYEVAPLLWNRWEEAMSAVSPRQALLDRLFTVVDVAGLDEDRVRDWIIVREVCNVLWTYEEHVPRRAPIHAELGDGGHHHPQGRPTMTSPPSPDPGTPDTNLGSPA